MQIRLETIMQWNAFLSIIFFCLLLFLVELKKLKIKKTIFKKTLMLMLHVFRNEQFVDPWLVLLPFIHRFVCQCLESFNVQFPVKIHWATNNICAIVVDQPQDPPLILGIINHLHFSNPYSIRIDRLT